MSNKSDLEAWALTRAKQVDATSAYANAIRRLDNGDVLVIVTNASNVILFSAEVREVPATYALINTRAYT